MISEELWQGCDNSLENYFVKLEFMDLEERMEYVKKLKNILK